MCNSLLAPAILSVTGTIIWYKRWRETSSDLPDQDEVGTRPLQLSSRPVHQASLDRNGTPPGAGPSSDGVSERSGDTGGDG